MAIHATQADLKRWAERGLIDPALAKPAKVAGKRAVALVEWSFTPPATWVIPLVTANETNARGWQAKNRRAGEAWRAVRRCVCLNHLRPFEQAAAEGRPVYAHFVRLGGRRLDPLVGLPAALKGVEDAFCFLIGIDDGSPLWRPSADQEPGGPCGVRVTIHTASGQSTPWPTEDGHKSATGFVVAATAGEEK